MDVTENNHTLLRARRIALLELPRGQRGEFLPAASAADHSPDVCDGYERFGGRGDVQQ